MTIVGAFEDLRAQLSSAEHPFSLLSEHQTLIYFMSNKNLSRRQAQWAKFLLRFNFGLTYGPGKTAGKLDALTRWSKDKPEQNDETYQNCMTMLSTSVPLAEQLEKLHSNMRLLADIPPKTGREKTLIELFEEALLNWSVLSQDTQDVWERNLLLLQDHTDGMLRIRERNNLARTGLDTTVRWATYKVSTVLIQYTTSKILGAGKVTWNATKGVLLA